MEKYFDKIETLEELNLKRSELLSEINKQYRERREALQNSETGIKPLRFLHLSAVEIPEQPTFAAMAIDKGNVPSNTIRIQNNIVSI